MKRIDKSLLLAELRSRVSASLLALTDSQRASTDGATHEESRSEHAKDTRAVEASYLARGLAERVQILEAEVALLATLAPISYSALDPIGLTALVGLERRDGTSSVVWIAPVGAGEQLEIEGLRIRVVTAASPLGRSLLSQHVGDEFELSLPGGTQELCIRWLQ